MKKYIKNNNIKNPGKLFLKLFLFFSVSLFLNPTVLHAGKEPPLEVGETLYYKIHWKGIVGGYARIFIKKKTTYKGRNVLVLEMRATGSETVNAFFPVDDTLTTYWDYEKRIPLYTYKNLNEGNYHRRYKAYFYPAKKMVTWAQKEIKGNAPDGKKIVGAKWEEKNGAKKNLPSRTQDSVSTLAFTRTDSRKGGVGHSFSIPVFDDTKLTDLKMKIVKKTTLKTIVGTFKAIVVEPHFKIDGIFKHKGRLLVYVSDDENRYPLKVEAKIPILGALVIELVRIKKPELDDEDEDEDEDDDEE
jgi:hypothetical protein